MDERLAYIALNMMEDVGPVGVRALAERLGSVAAIMEAPAEDLATADGVGPKIAGRIVDQRAVLDPGREIESAARLGARLLTPPDAEYPAPLREIHDPPLALTLRGELQSRDAHAVAVVGTRRPSHYALDVADRLSRQLARAGMTVVSGLARGIDTAAHRGALRAEGRTIAILGSGLDCLYPAENARLADEIADCGAVMTELPLGRKPDRTTFPMRNRIVSGISKGIVVVEAGIRSGAMITAHQALEQGRSVFAVPGRIDNPNSRGTHSLIRDGACLVESADDILGEFEYLIPLRQATAAPAAERSARPVLNEEEQTLLDVLSHEELDVDSVIRLSGLSAARVNALLVGLEMKRALKMLPGHLVTRVR